MYKNCMSVECLDLRHTVRGLQCSIIFIAIELFEMLSQPQFAVLDSFQC